VVSIVIPAWRDREALEALLGSLVPQAEVEVIVALAIGDTIEYGDLAKKLDWIRWVEGPRGRASQMNAGARVAAGRWLIFLHADSRLPAGWLDVVASADADDAIVGGSFRFVLDTADWRARVIEHGVRLRVRLMKLPYGDQALFVRRSVFERLGGYADLPLMEDVELIRRLRKAGTLMFSPAPVITSPRRWERDGWIRRSAHNVTLATRYLLGASAARLARQYTGRKPTALVVMARAPWTGGKTRLGNPGDPAHATLREALFLDTLDAARSLADADCLVACEPAMEVPAMRRAIDPRVDVLAQRGDTLGDRLAHLFEDTFRLGYESVLVVGSDLPDLPHAALARAHAALAGGADRVVLGPATDGGYYLVGLRRMHPELFDGVDWGTSRVMEQTTAIAARIGLPIERLQEWSDVDGLDDLGRFSGDAGGDGARRTRQWMAGLDGRPQGSGPRPQS
jgi:rSAM/selenodomain-associated transferase 2/rSAM/selenodomain-associated transferase 1